MCRYGDICRWAGAHFFNGGRFFPLRSDLSFRSGGSARSELLRNSSLRSCASLTCASYLRIKKREEGTAHSVSRSAVRFSSQKPCLREPAQRMPAPQADLREERVLPVWVVRSLQRMPAPQADLCEGRFSDMGVGFLPRECLLRRQTFAQG